MDIRHQVNTLEQGKKLAELGLKTGANYYYSPFDGSLMGRLAAKDILSRPVNKENPPEFVPAYTSAELGVMLPPYTGTKFMDGYKVWKIEVTINGVDLFETASTEAQARCEMLIRLLSNTKYRIFMDEVKERLIAASNL